MFIKTANNNKSKSNNNLNAKNTNAFIQPKLNVGKPGDKYEVEADKMADQVVAKNNDTTTAFIAPAPTIQKQAEEEVQKQEEQIVQEKPLVESITPVLQLKPLDTIQKQADEEVQTKEDEEIQEKEEEEVQTLQMQATADTGDTSSIENNLNKGGGSPLASNTKNEMESGFGADFGGVRVHNDSNAVQMNKELGSQAFTNGNDIYFNEGKYNPSSNSGKHLLAHELTHTVQQGASSSSVQQKIIQKDGVESETVNPPEGVDPINESGGEFSFTKNGLVFIFNDVSKELMIPIISVSDFKVRNENKFNVPLEVPRGRNTSQINNWRTGVEAAASRNLDNKISEARRTGGFSRAESDDQVVYFFKGVGKPELNIFGNRESLLELAKIPIWDRDKNATTFQVDHIVEHQLGGTDIVGNYELLEASANGSSGSSIAWEMNKRIKSVYDVFDSDYYKDTARADNPNLPARPSRTNQYVNLFLNNNYKISFLDFDFDLTTKSGMPDRYWSFREINQGEHLNKIEALTGDEMREMGTEDDPALFLSSNGGERMNVPAEGNYPILNWLNRVDLLSRPDFTNLTMNVDAYKAKEVGRPNVSASYSNMTWHLSRIPNTYMFYVNKEQTLQNALTGTGGVFQSLRIPGMSPIRMDQLDLTENGFQGIGKVLPTVPLIADADIEIVIDGDGIRLRKLFSAQEFNFPSPFTIDEATLEVSFGTNGLGIEGRIDFGINNVGKGHIGAAASTSGGFELEGAFNFDSELFDPAEINVEYKDNIWTIGGQIGIPEGKIQGVKSATITASYSENTFTATGNAILDIPGIQEGTMSVEYSDEGFSIGGDFQLKNDIPGIRGGSVSATISKQNGEEDYNIMVSGTAQPDIPGINSSLTVTYDNGALTLEGSVDYSRGMLSGRVEVGATNRTIDENGEPTGDPDDTMRLYGGGSLTLQLTPWLAATAGVKFLPNGEMEVAARLETDTYDVFPRKEFTKNLFTVPTIEIPLFAIPLGPRSVGLVAQIGGGLDFKAGFGPGQLRNLSAEITYNPDREDETTVAGHGEFGIPADAGLTLRGDLGLGVSIAIASVSGGIELAGTLGLEGEALASVDVNWSPQTGLAIDANGSITVNPKFTFDLNAFLRASLGIGWFSISETWRYNLASFEWGSDINFGINFPIHYREGEPFDMSFDDIEVIYPEIDVVNIAKGVAQDKQDDIIG